MEFRCATCNEIHDGLPHIGFEFPDPYFDIPEVERASRIRVNSDLCSIDDDDYFIRGVIHIHVHEIEQDFGFGVWVSQKKENFETYLNNYDSDEIGPFFGWLSNNIRCYPESTLLLKTMAHFRGEQRPSIEVEFSDHPLAADQKNGITLERAWDLVHNFL